MTVCFAIGLVCITLSSTVSAAVCKNDQHCSDCDSQTGHCLTGCYPGYFDKTCSSNCSWGCHNHTCTLSDKGIERCTEGCITGYQGTKCKVPCDSPTVRCTKCPVECNDGFCQTGSSCVSGCVDSYYGTDCKNCSETCTSCNRSMGTCEVCHATHFGPQCQHRCEHCLGTCQTGCKAGCEPGFYGYQCDMACSKQCRPNASHDCFPVDVNSCVSECDKASGECPYGCADGWYGNNCSSPCNPKCKDRRCNIDGACADGCLSGNFGKECKPCPYNCKYTCDQKNGYCINGCNSGLYGNLCNHSCEICREGVCDQDTGLCINGCNISEGVCKSACKHNCSREDCLQETCENDQRTTHGTFGIQIGIPTSFVLFVVGIVAANCFCYRKGLCTKRKAERSSVSPEPIPRQQAGSSTEYQALHRYWEIHEDGMDMEYETMNGDEEDSDVMADIPVVADCFQDVSDEAVSDVYGPNPDSYTHLMRDIPIYEPNMVVKYISPTDD